MVLLPPIAVRRQQVCPPYMFGAQYTSGQKVLNNEDGLGQVWISGYDFAHNINQLDSNGIGAVCSGVDLGFKYPAHIKHIKFDLDDCLTQDARYAFRPAFQFVEESRKTTNVLVHCAAGISRSSTLLTAYMIQKYHWSFDKCLALIKSKRSCCQPNSGFQKQLRELEANHR